MCIEDVDATENFSKRDERKGMGEKSANLRGDTPSDEKCGPFPSRC